MKTFLLTHVCMHSKHTLRQYAVLCTACRKVLPFPVFGGITKPALAAEWPVGGADGWRDSWRRPRLQLGLSVDDAPSSNDDGATLTSNGSLAFRKKLFVTRRWGVEVRLFIRHSL
jgi:hypothetical protein